MKSFWPRIRNIQVLLNMLHVWRTFYYPIPEEIQPVELGPFWHIFIIAMVFKDFFEVRWAHVRVHLVLFLVFRRLLRLLPLIFCMVDALRQNKVRVSSHSASFFILMILLLLLSLRFERSHPAHPTLTEPHDFPLYFRWWCEWRLCWELPEQPCCSSLFSFNPILWLCQVYIFHSFLLLLWPRSLSFSAIILSAFFVQQDGHTIFCLLRESLLDLLRDRTFDQTFISRQVSLVCAW